MFFEDDRSDEEVEKEVKEEKGTKERQTGLREGGFASFEAESSLDEIEDPKMDITEDYNE